MEAHPGQHMGKYRILEEIGRGSVSTVYKGYDPEQDRPVAIKVLAPHLAGDQDFTQRFLHQARATAQLDHPHLVTVLDAGQQNGWTWMGMEYLEGIPLRELIRLQGPMLAGEAQAIVRQLAAALDYVHSAGLIHGDVRAGNVIVCPPGQTRLTELGVVCTRWEGQIANSAVSAAIAPEQVTGSELGPWTDLYALGVLAYELLGGRPPYASDTTAGLLSQIVHEPIPSLGPLRPDLPAAVGSMLEKALAKEPRARYGSGAELTAALEEALQLPQGNFLGKPPTEDTPAPPSPTPSQPVPTAAGPLPATPTERAAPSPPVSAAAPAAPPTAAEQAARPTTAPPPPRPPEPHSLPPWESVPIRATPPAQSAPAAAKKAAPKITQLPSTPSTHTPPSTPADRIARLRSTPGKASSAPDKRAPKARRPIPWLWLLLGGEVLLLLAGIVLIVLLVTGVL